MEDNLCIFCMFFACLTNPSLHNVIKQVLGKDGNVEKNFVWLNKSLRYQLIFEENNKAYE